MDKTIPDVLQAARQKPAFKLSRDTVSLVGDLLPILDFFGILVAAYFATMLFSSGMLPVGGGAIEGISSAALAAAVLAPIILCDRSFVAFASNAQTAAMVRCYLLRFGIFLGVVLVVGATTRILSAMPNELLILWAAAALFVTALMRGLLVAGLRQLEARGVLTESVAIVGSGPACDALVETLSRMRHGRIKLLGVFDDRHIEGCTHKPVGTLSQLLELGQRRPVDWMLVVRPEYSEAESLRIVHRLKALPVPIALWPADPTFLDDLAAGRADGSPAVNAPSAPAATVRIRDMLAASAALPPRWIITMLLLPWQAVRWLWFRLLRARNQSSSDQTLTLDDYDLEGFTQVAQHFGQQRFGYVVTPNADHLIRLHREPSFRALYDSAAYVLLDSRFISHLLRVRRRLKLKVCPGSDLTAALLDGVIGPDDNILLIGGSDEQAGQLRTRYGLSQLVHFNPPMGFIHDPQAVEECLSFVEAHSPFRFCFLALGSPQQEMLAQHLQSRGVARGMAMCIGASINFLTGVERRAPAIMQRMGMEWMYRLVRAPRRMAGRYLVRGPRLFLLLGRTRIWLRSTRRKEAQMPVRHARLPANRLRVRLFGFSRHPTDSAQPGRLRRRRA